MQRIKSEKKRGGKEVKKNMNIAAKKLQRWFQNHLSAKSPTPSPTDAPEEGLVRLSREITEFNENIVREMQPRLKSCDRILHALHHTILSVFPCARLELTGSYAYGGALPSSDIDCFYTYGAGIRSGLGLCSKGSACMMNLTVMEQLQQLQIEFCRQMWVVSGVRLEKGRDTPLLSMKVCLTCGDEKGNPEKGKAHNCFAVDLSCGDWPGHSKSLAVDLILFYVHRFPSFRPVLLVLKEFLKERELNLAYNGGLGSFPLALMLIRLLQVPNLCLESTGRILLEFFRFYGFEFDPKKFGLSILNGGTFFPLQQPSLVPIFVENPMFPGSNSAINCYMAFSLLESFKQAYLALVRVGNNQGLVEILGDLNESMNN